MKTVIINKHFDSQVVPQTFSYTKDAPLGHIQRHLAAELSYARKGQSSVFALVGKVEGLKISLLSSEGLSDSDKSSLENFLKNL